MASGIPWSRAEILPTAGAFAFVTSNAGSHRAGPGDEQPDGFETASSVAADTVRRSVGRFSRSSSGSRDGSGGAGSPGTANSCSP